MTEVLPGLFLGSISDAERMAGEVDLVVNCTGEKPFYLNKLGASCIRLAVNDDGDPSRPLELYDALSNLSVFREIETALENKRVVLVHCNMGQQRSPAVVSGYLMYKHGLSADAAMAQVKERKRDAFFFQANFHATLLSLDDLLNSSESVLEKR